MDSEKEDLVIFEMKYMRFMELLEDERAEGHAEGRTEDIIVHGTLKPGQRSDKRENITVHDR